MRRALAFGGVLAVVLGGSGEALAQTRVHTESKTKQTGPGPNVVTKSETVTGVVKEYRAGKRIEVAGPNDKRYSFDLDGTVRVDGPVIVGQMAKVTWVKRDGRERVTVVAPYAVGIRASAAAARKPPKAGANARSESTTSSRQTASDAKTKSGVVVGIVKAYEPGRRLTVDGPSGEDYTFELDDRVGIRGDVAVGSTVRVEYTRSGDGDHVTVIERVPPRAR